MKNLFFLVLLFFNSIVLFSQDLPAREIITPSNFVMKVNADANAYIEGSVFYNKKWNSTIIINTLDGKKYRVPNSNYSLKDNAFVIKTPTDSIYKIEVDNTAFVIFNKMKFKFMDSNYYKVISKGKINLFKQYFLKIQEGRIDAISKSKVTEDKYVKAFKYYIKTDYGLVEVSPSKKRIQKYFDDSKKSVMKKYVKKNSLSYKKEEDLKNILSYYNSL